jgi:translocation and assembly module TamA
MIKCLLILFLSFPAWVFSQHIQVNWRPLDKEDRFMSEHFSVPDQVDSLAILEEIGAVLLHMWNEGYLEASIDSFLYQHPIYTVFVHCGPQYQWDSVRLTGSREITVPGRTQSELDGSVFSSESLDRRLESWLLFAEQAGFPFASIRLDSLAVKQGSLSGLYTFEPGEQIRIEEIRTEGDVSIHPSFLQKYLGLESGDIFQTSAIYEAERRLDALPFVRQSARPTVSVFGQGATATFYLEKRSSNRFDILLGLVPSMNENRRFDLSGDVNITMLNALHRGERVRINFENLRPATQKMEVALTYPYLLGSPLGIDLQLDLFRQDSTYLDINYEAGFQYLFRGDNFIKFFIRREESSLLTVDEASVIQSGNLPKNLDIVYKGLGAEIQHNRLDYRFNPRKGWSGVLKFIAGRRKINKNSKILDLQDPSDSLFSGNTLYDNIGLEINKFQITTSLAQYFPVFSQSTIKLGMTGGIQLSKGEFFDNELFRIGGTRILRGFDEEAIFTSRYLIATVEYRILFTQNSNVFAFSDWGWVKYRTGDLEQIDLLTGAGLGLNLETRIGIFGISYALGKFPGESLSFRDGKIHFGMVSLF